MPPRSTFAAPRRQQLEVFQIQDFSGGWNPRDAPSELAPNESPDMINVSMDERGGVVKRLGQTRIGSGSTLTANLFNSFYWPGEGLGVVQDGAVIRKTSDFITFTTITTFSTSDTVSFCDFNDKLIMAHPVDGVFSYRTATGLSARLGAPVKGDKVTVWQNKIWLAGDTDHKSRVWWSNAGDETTWTTAVDWVDVRELDGELITAIGAGQTMDVTAKPTLLVFKKFSTHRINDSTTGSYSTISASDGAVSQLAVVNQFGRTYFCSPRGIFYTDGVSAPIHVSEKITPLFNSNQLDYTKTEQWCAGVYQNRVLFSLTRTGSATNNITIEHSPVYGWCVPHSFGISSFMRWANNDNLCYGTSPTAGKVYQVFKGGSDDGAAITSRFQTRWYEPNAGHQCQLRRMIVEGRGLFDLYFKTDYTTADGDLNSVAIAGGGFTWGTENWNAAAWGPSTYENYQSFYSLGVARSLSFLMKHTGTTSTTAPKLLTDGAAAEVGAFACYGLDLEYVRLGYA